MNTAQQILLCKKNDEYQIHEWDNNKYSNKSVKKGKQY